MNRVVEQPQSISPDFDRARKQFPALRDKVFLDSACVSLAPRAATEAIREFLKLALHCPARSATQHHIALDELRARARASAARLIGACEEELALVESTTHGLSLAAQALPLGRGDRVLLGDLEFLEVALPWCQLQKTAGVELDVVANRSGELQPEDFAARMCPRTRVLAISSVQWSHGFRCDLAGLSALCRERGVWLVVDAIQQLGAMPLDVREIPVDILACGGHKWLNAPFGAGFLFLRRERQAALRPPLAGYLSLETPAGGWGNYFETPSISPVRDSSLVNQARRWEVGGTSNYPGAAGLTAAIELIVSLGQQRIAERIRSLTNHLLEGLDTLGVTVVTPRAPEHRSGIITFSLGSPEQNRALLEFLLDNNVMVSLRYTSGVGGVRVSCHFFNSVADLDRLLNLVGDFQRHPSTTVSPQK